MGTNNMSPVGIVCDTSKDELLLSNPYPVLNFIFLSYDSLVSTGFDICV